MNLKINRYVVLLAAGIGMIGMFSGCDLFKSDKEEESITGPTSPDEGTDESLKLIVNEDFESYSAGTNKTALGDNWIVYSEEDGPMVVPVDIDDTVYASGNKSLKMRSYGDRRYGGAGVLFDQSSDVTVIEFSLRIDNSVSGTGLLSIVATKGMDDKTGSPVFSLGIGFSGNEIVVSETWTGNSIKTGKTYSLNTWVKLKMKIDTKNNKFTVWVNDEATSSATTNANLTSQGAITGFWIGLYRPDTLITLNGWVDDIKIYQGQ